MRKNISIYVILISMIILVQAVFAQTTVFSEIFTGENGVWASSGQIGSTSLSINRLGDDWGGRVNNNLLELSNDISGTANVAGWTFAYNTNPFSTPYTSILNANPGLMTWSFNFRQIRTDPAGFGAGNYGVAVILAGSITTAFNQGTGYAVVLGQSYGIDPVRLAKYAGGLNYGLTDIIASNTTGLTDFGNEYLSVIVTYNPSTEEWELFLRNDGISAFADPLSGSLVSQGTATDNTYTGTALPYFGAYWQGSTSANQTAFFDNFTVVVSSGGGVTEPTAQPTDIVFSNVTSTTMEVAFTAANPAPDGYLAIRKVGSAPTSDPVDGVAYSEGTSIGDGVVAYRGSGTSFSQSSLSPSTNYFYKLYSYNGSGSLTDYLVTVPLTGSQITNETEPFNGYYNSVAGLSGDNLKNGLHTLIMNTHTTVFNYTDTTDQLKYTDEDSTNVNNVILTYTGWSIPKSEYNTGDTGWNKEHTWSDSHGINGTTPAYTDLHHLRPCDATVNSAKSDRDFDEGDTPYSDSTPYPGYSEVTGCYTGYYAWEPREVEKGDIARMIFYMDTRYSGDDFVDLQLVDYVNSAPTTSPNGEPYYGKFSTLLAWHYADPPDSWERRRNNRIQERQGNRNPFIDHPEYVASIYGGAEMPSIITAPVTDITYTSATTGGEVTLAGSAPVTARGVCWNTSGAPTLSDNHTIDGSGTGVFVSYLTGLTSGQTYYVRAYATNSVGTNYGAEVNFIAQPSTGYATDLFISEYIEGSSYNKALEVFNGTGQSVNLQNYRIANYYNGGTVPNTLVLDNINLPHGEVYTIVNNQAGTELQALGDLVTGSFAISFNGNDAVVLEKTSNGTDWVYVDIFGRVGDDPGAAWTGDGGYSTVDKTLVRKSSVASGITANPTGTGVSAFTTLTTEWDLYPSDTFTDFGTHTFNPATTLAAPENVVISLSGSDVMISWDAVTGANSYKIYASNDPYAEPFPGSWTVVTSTLNLSYQFSSTEAYRFFRVVASTD